MLSWSSILNRTVLLKAEVKRLIKRFIRPRIVVTRGDAFNRDDLLRIPVTHSDVRRRNEKGF
jgi:hypothetical protein